MLKKMRGLKYKLKTLFSTFAKNYETAIEIDMKKIIFSFLALICMAFSFAAPVTKDAPYRIEVKMTDIKDTSKVFLAFYYNGKTYSKDTAQFNGKGVAVFDGSKREKDKQRLEEGVYIVYFKQDKFFDLLVGKDQNIKLKADTTDLTPVVTMGSESVMFSNLVKFMSDKNKERKDLVDRKKAGKIDSVTFEDKLKKLSEDVEAFQKKEIETNKGTFYSEFVRGTISVDVPDFAELPDTARPMARYQYTKNHFFDNINLSDPRMLRTPYFPGKVDNYMTRLIPVPDSLFAAADVLIQKSEGNDETYQTMLSKMMNYGLKSNMMGMDKMWYQIAEKYYLSGKAKWADSSWIEDLKAECKKVRYNMIGMTAKNLKMLRQDSSKIQLKDLRPENGKNEFVLVYFFEPSCGHCKKITPVLHDSVYVKYKDKGFEVFCCYTQTDKKEWVDFLNKHNLHDWVNVWDPNRESYFWEFYDATVTPGVYLLNKERKIVAKKISTESLDQILEEELIKRKETKK